MPCGRDSNEAVSSDVCLTFAAQAPILAKHMSAASPVEILRVGVIGCGRAAVELHLPALARAPRLRLSALCDSDPQQLARAAPGRGGVSRHADYRDLIADPAVDIVLVTVPTPRHAEAFVAAVEAGKHVYVEKPLALDLAEADRMLAAAALSRSRTVLGFNLRSHRLVRAARARLRAGALGRIVALRTILVGGLEERLAWQRSRSQGGGAVYELGSHHFDLWRFLLDTEVEDVRAQSLSDVADDSTAMISARLSNGALAVSLLALRGVATHDVEVIGEQGAMRFSLYRGGSFEMRPAGRTSRLTRWLRGLPAAARSARRGGDYLDSYRVHWLRFAEHLRGGESPATVEDGRRSLEVALAAFESACSGAGR